VVCAAELDAAGVELLVPDGFAGEDVDCDDGLSAGAPAGVAMPVCGALAAGISGDGLLGWACADGSDDGVLCGCCPRAAVNRQRLATIAISVFEKLIVPSLGWMPYAN
jgi:hypothetical protein